MKLSPGRKIPIIRTLLALLAFAMSVPGYSTAVADPNVGALKTDVLTDDVDSDGKADPGDTITYTVIISNTGNMDATGVSFSDTVDTNTTLVAGSVKTTPLALDDMYNVTGNVGISVSAPGLLANDSDPDGGSVTAIANVGTTTHGDFELFVDGSFDYDADPGFTGNDSFNYDIIDTDGNVDNGTVNISVNDMVWFIDNSQGTNGDGRLNSPFNCLVGTGCFDPAAADDAGDNIFLYEGTYTGGLTLLNNQKLIGDGALDTLETITGISLPADSNTLPVPTGTKPGVTGSVDVITVGQGNTIRGLEIGSGTGTGIGGTTVGTLSVSDTSLSGGGALDINGGVLAVSLDALSASSSTAAGIRLVGSGTFSVSDPNGTISINGFPGVDITGTGGGLSVTATFASISSTNSNGRGIRLTNLTSGSIFNGGNATVTASTVDGVVLNNNTGSTFTFADLDIDNFSNNQRGLFVSTSGTLNVSSGDIDGGSNRGVDIDNTILAVTLTRVDSVGGTLPGIDLNTTTGSLSVTGTGSPGTGGTIANKTGANGSNNGIGVLLSGASGVSLSRMQINDCTNYAIRGTNVNDFDLLNSVVNGTNGTVAGEGSVRFNNLTGTANITNSTIAGAVEDNLRVINTTGTLNRLTVSGGTIGLNSTSLGNDGILAQAQNSATLNVTVDEVLFLGARGDLLQTNTLGNSTMDIVVTDNTFQNAHPNIVSAGGGITLSGGSGSSNITVTYDVSGTTAGSQTFRDAEGNAITINYLNGAGTATGTVENNNIGVAGVAGSGSATQSGMLISVGGSVTHTVTINNNFVRRIAGFAGLDLSALSASTLNATITNNTVTEMSGFVLAGMYLLAGGGGGDTSTLCADIQNNTVNASGVSFSSSMFFDQVSVSANHNLPGYTGSPHGEFGSPNTGTASANIESYLNGRGNSLTAGVSAFFDVDASFVQGVTGTGTACPLTAALGQGPGGVDLLSKAQLAVAVASAIERWSAHGLSQAELIRLQRAKIDIVDLPDGQLGSTGMMRISVDHNGAGYGWSTGKTAAGRMDLLTVVLHEMGHVLGKSHVDAPDLMAATLATGVRRTPPVKTLPTIKSVKVSQVDRVETTRVTIAATPIALPIATSVMAAVLGGDYGSVAGVADVNVSIGTLPPSKSVTVTFDVTVNGSILGGTTEICNQGNVSGNNFPNELTDDPSEIGVDNPTCTLLDVDTSDFAITKDDGQTTATPGGTVEYTIVVTNNGPDDATGATVSDTFPPDLSCSTTCVASAGSSCAAGTISGNISDSVDLLNGGTATYTAVCSISASATGSLSNTAIVMPPADRNDPDTSDNSATDKDTLSPKADLSIDKEDDADPVTAGDNIVYTITVDNLGPSDATGVSVSDTLPAVVTFFETVGCVEDPNGFPTCTLPNIAAGGNKAYTIEVVTSDPASIGTIMNTATVSSATTDPISSNDSDTESTTVAPTNQPPTAACVKVAPDADANCCFEITVADIDAGSFDPDGAGDIASICITELDGAAKPCVPSVTICDDGTFAPHSISLTITDTAGESDTCTTNVTLFDVEAPSITCPADFGVPCDDPTGAIVTYTVPTASDNCDPTPSVNCVPASGTFFLSGITTVECTATDSTGNIATCSFDVTVGGQLDIEAIIHTVGGGSFPGTTKEPFVGLKVGIFDKAAGSCARDVCGGVSWQKYACIVSMCPAIASGITDSAGLVSFFLPDGDYLAIGDDGTDKHLGASVGGVACGDTVLKHLRQIVTAGGKTLSGKTSRRTGSELLIIEPEYIEWTGDTALYPIIFDSLGDWTVTTAVSPPEGFVADNDSLAEDVFNEVEAVQFTVTDIGSEWVPTELTHVVEHGRRRETILSRVGVLLSPTLAAQKGLDRFGHELDARGDPILPVGRDPRAARQAEIVGWIEPSELDEGWTVKIQVNETSVLSLAITRGRGLVVKTLADGEWTPGEYEFVWAGPADGRLKGGSGGRYFVTLISGEMTQRALLFRTPSEDRPRR